MTYRALSDISTYGLRREIQRCEGDAVRLALLKSELARRERERDRADEEMARALRASGQREHGEKW